MKNLIKIFALLFAMGMFIVACDDVNLNEPELDAETTQDNAFAAVTVKDVFAAVNSGTSTGKSAASCGTVVYEPGDIGYTMTITYPEGGCMENGVLKTGVISATFTGAWTKDAVATITFDNYAVDGHVLSGTITATFKAIEPYPVFTVVASQMSLAYDGGASITWNSNRTLTMMAGYATLADRSDDAWKISGTSEGVARNGKSFTRTETDLLTSADCKWFVDGTIVLTVEGDDPYKMTFNETCGSVTFEYKGISITKTLN